MAICLREKQGRIQTGRKNRDALGKVVASAWVRTLSRNKSYV